MDVDTEGLYGNHTKIYCYHDGGKGPWIEKQGDEGQHQLDLSRDDQFFFYNSSWHRGW